MQHKETHLEIRQQYPCKSCSKSFSTKWNLEAHIKYVHEKVKNYQCEVCDKFFAKKADKNIHVLAVHKGIKKLYKYQSSKCIECNKVFSKKANMKAHVLSVHKGIKHHKRDKKHDDVQVYLNLKIETVGS